MHIGRGLSKVLQSVLPKYAHTMEETSETKWPEIHTTYKCPDKPEALNMGVHTIIKSDGNETDLPDEFKDMVPEKEIKNIHVSFCDFGTEIKKAAIEVTETSYCYKLFIIDANIFG